MSSPARTLTAKSFFSPRGLLSQWHTNYEHRPGQLEMAKAVQSAIEDKRTLLVEAGTGTGKTLAYLIPAILSAAAVVASPGAAQADPTSCLAWKYSLSQTAAQCNGGTGTYRAVALCSYVIGQYRAYGPTVRIGGLSVASCASGHLASNPSVQIMSI